MALFYSVPGTYQTGVDAGSDTGSGAYIAELEWIAFVFEPLNDPRLVCNGLRDDRIGDEAIMAFSWSTRLLVRSTP